MRRSIRAHEASSVDGEADGQLLNSDIVHHLIVGALQERRIDGGKRLIAFGRKTCRESHGMLFGDPDVEHTMRRRLCECIEAGTDAIAAVMATIFGSASASFISVWPNTLV